MSPVHIMPAGVECPKCHQEKEFLEMTDMPDTDAADQTRIEFYCPECNVYVVAYYALQCYVYPEFDTENATDEEMQKAPMVPAVVEGSLLDIAIKLEAESLNRDYYMPQDLIEQLRTAITNVLPGALDQEEEAE